MREPILYTHIKKFSDNRGSFYESFKHSGWDYVQTNHSISHRGVIRGMHYQWDGPMDKLVRVSKGSILDVIVDIRKESPYYGKVYYYELDDQNLYQLLVPAGFAHGFQALEDDTHVQYMCSHFYNREGESGISPLDPELTISWPIKGYILSEKDDSAKSFAQYRLDPKF